MPADKSPLLVLDSDESQPWLSSGPMIPEESSFSRLISQTNPVHGGFAPLGRSALPSHSAFPATEPSYSLITASVSLYTLFVGFLIASFVNDSWQETILQITIASYEPANFILQSRPLASLFQDSDSFGSMLILWISYFLLPSLFVILIPLWMVGDFSAWRLTAIRSSRLRTEQFAMVAMLLVWLQAAQSMALTGISIQTSTGQLLVRNQSGAGWTTFCLAMCCCLAALVALRFTHPLLGNECESRRASCQGTESQESMTPLLLANLRSPPPEAFARFPFRQAQRSLLEEEISMSVLEEPPMTPRPRTQPNTALSTPELIDEANESRSPPARLSYCQRVIAFQLALLSIVLWIPSMYIPVYSVHYHGLAAVFLEEPQKMLFVWSLANPYQELPSEDRFYNNVLISVVTAVGLVIVPVGCTCLAVLVWLGDGSWSTSSRRILYALQPALGSGVMLLAALLIASDTLDLGDSAQICSKLFLDMDCLTLTGRLEVGAWMYALQAVVLLAFVHYTLQQSWKC